MIDYQTTIPYTVGAFPNTVSQNATGPGATDGTPWIKSVIDDLWGARQVLINESGQTPNALTESVANGSQAYEAIRRITGYAGEVIYWAGQTNIDGTWSVPSSEDIRLLELAGQGILIANYPELDKVVYCGDARNGTAEKFYHSSDSGGAVRNVAGPYLQLPESRGMFLRGFDPQSLYYDPYNDEMGSNREIGDAQLYAFQEHCHGVGLFYSGLPYSPLREGQVDKGSISPFDYIEAFVGDEDTTKVWAMRQSRTMTAPDGDCPEGTTLFYWSENETRPINLSFRICIRY